MPLDNKDLDRLGYMIESTVREIMLPPLRDQIKDEVMDQLSGRNFKLHLQQLINEEINAAIVAEVKKSVIVTLREL